MSLLTIPFQHYTRNSSSCNKKKKGGKYIDCKEEIKMSLFTDDTIVYLKKLKNFKKKLLELISDDKISEYKVNI